VEVEVAKGGQNLLMRKVLLNREKEIEDSVQQTRLFSTACKTKDKVFMMIIDSGSTYNVLSTEMVEKLKLETTAHPSP
jgi:hypothetical protein